MTTTTVTSIEGIIEPTLTASGYEIVRCLLIGSHRPTLQVMIERVDGRNVAVEDCVAVSRMISALLDVEDPIAGGYTLEVSSPGIDRPLTKPQHYARFAGREAKVELRFPVDGRKRFCGRLLGLEGDGVRIRTAQGESVLPIDNVRSAKLLLTDELLAEAVKSTN